MSLADRLDTLAGRLMATTEHHQYAQLVLEAATELRRACPESAAECICPQCGIRHGGSNVAAGF